MITTKKGAGTAGQKKGVGVTSIQVSLLDLLIKPPSLTYQKKYGGGYGQYYGGPGRLLVYEVYQSGRVNLQSYLRPGQRLETQWVVTSEDASYGAPFDGQTCVYQWDAVDPESPNYLKATPWKVADNGPATFFYKPVTFTNTVSIDNAFSKGIIQVELYQFQPDRD